MDKLKMHTPNKADENFRKLAELFPNAVTETKDENGEVVRAIDKDVLMQEISTTVVEGREERYQFTWPDKKKAVLLANAPIANTLRPCREESVGKDGTPGGFDSENLYIEGDNLEVLKLLQETYLGKIKMIYIDPPYNTGNDFVYEDDFAQSTQEYLANSGQYDEEGNRLVKNMDTNGRFHTDWLNMIYPRLKLAKNLLSDDGVIFISIDDNEVANLRKICDEIFGQDNFLACIVWEKRFTRSNNARLFASLTDYILTYRKSSAVSYLRTPRTQKSDSIYSNPDNDPRGVWTSVSYVNPATKEQRPNLSYAITNPITGKEVVHPTNAWKYEYETYLRHVKEKRLYWGTDGENTYPRLKKFLSEVNDGMVPVNLWKREEVGTTDSASKALSALMGLKVFDFPKSVELIKLMIQIAAIDKNSVILDFFSGSSTTAHAVMQLNAEDGGNRKFIMVQLSEETDEKSEAYKAGYKNICEIGKERIRRAGAKIKEENPMGTMDLDAGFRVLKCDTSNMKDVYYKPDEFDFSMMDILGDNIKEDRTPEDLLFQVMIDMGILLSSRIEETQVAGKKVFKVEDNYLIACFDEEVTDETITAVAKLKPYYFVMRDSSLASDSVAVNFEQIFATYSPDTIRKVL